ncbi:PREDICTED: methyl-CpG-binding domain protein 4-like [Nicrophorus vespilloides]|uniref:Methyl-CpG-binding domain protein 4-like n=1 Tax=Nicrophorus vespilloides TaxID=110193 RepID=A0ABM1NE93_NICVS|nr:PREDICTED: methyl-CpG-binding domain protein 4-like [Nicrophorus vespilloides]
MPRHIYLSKYFDSNCIRVAGMCAKCYEEQTDCKIIGVNRRFLRTNYSKDMKRNFEYNLYRERALDEKLSKWEPPKSPHHLIEETLYSTPWRLLVGTIFLNKTRGKLAKPYMDKFFDDFPNAANVIMVEPEALATYFEKLGLKKRAGHVWHLSRDYLSKSWRRARELSGIGKYGDDAFEIFCRGNMTVEPDDRYLRIYKAWYLNTKK